jgi:rRNA maturation protein Nop10
LKEWTTSDFRNTASTTNLEEEEIVDAPGSDGKASMPEQVKPPNPWRRRRRRRRRRRKKKKKKKMMNFKSGGMISHCRMLGGP